MKALRLAHIAHVNREGILHKRQKGLADRKELQMDVCCSNRSERIDFVARRPPVWQALPVIALLRLVAVAPVLAEYIDSL